MAVRVQPVQYRVTWQPMLAAAAAECMKGVRLVLAGQVVAGLRELLEFPLL